MEQVEQTQEIKQEIQPQGKNYLFLVVILIVLIFGAALGALLINNNNRIKKTEVESAKQTISIPNKSSVTVKNVPATIASEIYLEILSPKQSSVINSPSIFVKGKTVPQADVFVNDTEAKADSSGNFSVNLNLDEGENNITVLTNDSDGNFAEKELIVSYEPL